MQSSTSPVSITPSPIGTQIPKVEKKAIFDVALGRTYYCEPNHVDEIENGLTKIDKKIKDDEESLQKLSTTCSAECDKYTDKMMECKNTNCTELYYSQALSCNDGCYNQKSKQINDQLKTNEALGKQVYTLIDRYCDT